MLWHNIHNLRSLQSRFVLLIVRRLQLLFLLLLWQQHLVGWIFGLFFQKFETFEATLHLLLAKLVDQLKLLDVQLNFFVNVDYAHPLVDLQFGIGIVGSAISANQTSLTDIRHFVYFHTIAS